MTKPTATQIHKYLVYVHGLAAFQWLHLGDQEPQEDLVRVGEWLESLVDEDNETQPL